MGLLNYLGGRGRDGIASASDGLITISSHAVRRYSRGAFESDHLHAVEASHATWSLVAFHAGREALRGNRDLYDRDGTTGK